MIESQENSSFRNQQTQSVPTPLNSSETGDSNNLEFRPIEFTGTAGEYWGIFITNLLLSIVTLGVYSAWAKVRRKRYFLNSTQIDGISLNYHATGMQLFKGRLIAFTVIVISSILSNYFILEAGLIISVLFLFLVPWVLNRSMRFNARVTSWRNVRLNWRGTYWRSFAVMWLATPSAVLSLGILVPFISRWINQYYVRRYSFGVTSFQEWTAIGPFVKAFLLTVPFMIISGLTVVGVLTGVMYEITNFGHWLTGNIVFLVFGAGIILIAAYIWYRTMCRNIVVRSLALGDAVKFHSNLKPYEVVWIQMTNFLASVLSLGLLIPWAQIRIYRYLCNNTSYAFVRSADEFIDEEQRKMSSFGEEFAELEGVDFSL